ncbi:hypothetical protein ACIPL1_05295 [Pseudomonas sp. NPDC090202]|uniref:hypothetical protein n=1 Tax=unclassified Pseudomonas TaxID=196821 RepID=UPI0038006656
MINHLVAAASTALANKPATVTNTPGKPETAVAQTVKPGADKASFSTLARQLDESATRAAARDARLSHDELRKHGVLRISEFMIETKDANSGTRAMELPKSNDPELHDRARRASEFVTRTLGGDRSAKSPFENLSREQLNLIAYDDSGTFTLNERRAAWHGVQKLNEEWRDAHIPQGVLEQARTGKATGFYNEALNYLKSLPGIEKAVDYPQQAEAIIEARIKTDQTLPGLSGINTRGAPARKHTLYDVLAGIVDSSNRKDKESSPGSLTTIRKATPRTSAVPTSMAQIKQ